jgi:hypothetical protein
MSKQIASLLSKTQADNKQASLLLLSIDKQAFAQKMDTLIHLIFCMVLVQHSRKNRMGLEKLHYGVESGWGVLAILALAASSCEAGKLDRATLFADTGLNTQEGLLQEAFMPHYNCHLIYTKRKLANEPIEPIVKIVVFDCRFLDIPRMPPRSFASKHIRYRTRTLLCSSNAVKSSL